MIGRLGQDLEKAQTRILDHRVFVNGEIDSFLNNFEVKRNDIEVETLFKITETVGSLKYELSERCFNLGQAHLSEIDNSLKNLLEGVEKFIKDTNESKPPSDSIIKARQHREERKESIIKDFEHKQKRLDNSFEEKEEEIAELYSVHFI